MGHSVFLDRNNKPNFRIHVIIFVLIAGVSIFLSAMMEKSKVNTDIAALKSPVPIDSIELEVKTDSSVLPSIKPPVVEKTALKSAVFAEIKKPDSSIDRSVQPKADELPNVVAIDNHTNETEAAISEKPIELTANTNQMTVEAEVANLPVTESNMQVETQTVAATNVKQSSFDIKEVKKVSSINMDQAYQQQQDRFLLTLAKSAELESIDSSDIARIKDAILNDKTLPPGDGANAGSLNQQVKSESRLAVRSKKGFSSTKNSHVKSANDIVLTRGELDHILKQFTLYYNEGDIQHLMALFASNASTNDRQSKLGIKQDYNELFQHTESRRLKIKGMQWNLGKGKAEGQASFEVAVKQKNSLDTNLYRGNIKIIAVKDPRGVYITHLLHEVNPQ